MEDDTKSIHRWHKRAPCKVGVLTDTKPSMEKFKHLGNVQDSMFKHFPSGIFISSSFNRDESVQL